MNGDRKALARILVWATAVGGTVFFFSPSPGRAGTYHNSPLVCSDCHVMHASYAGTLYNAGAGFVNLLKATNTATLCLNCHASNGTDAAANTLAPRVAGSTGSGTGGRVGTSPGTVSGDSLAGGYFGPDAVFTNVSGGADYTSVNGHDLEVTAEGAAPPGADAADGFRVPAGNQLLTCSTCHDQHGNANYRNLKYDPNTNNAEINSCTVVVTVGGAANYRGDSDVWRASSGANYYGQDVTSFCQDCHERFGPINTYAGAAGQTGAGPYDNEGLVDNASGANSHHPIDSDLAATIGGNYTTYSGGDTVPLLRTSGAATPSGNSVFCLSCHRAHGSNRDSSLRWYQDPNVGSDTVAGGTAGCQICHSK